MVNVRPEVVAVMIQIIDKAASKGMFVGNEITTVGNIRGYLSEELQKIRPPEEGDADGGEYEGQTVKAKIQASEK